jgi:hypothetical protein
MPMQTGTLTLNDLRANRFQSIVEFGLDTINEVLQRAQTSPVQGRYEFLDVPLAFGLNTIRLVFYGSQGQIRETVRRINFGSGQLQPGRFVLRLGAVEQDRTVFDIGEPLAGSSSARTPVTSSSTRNLRTLPRLPGKSGNTRKNNCSPSAPSSPARICSVTVQAGAFTRFGCRASCWPSDGRTQIPTSSNVFPHPAPA